MSQQMEQAKTCSVCGELKELSQYHRDKKSSLGRSPSCKVCRRIEGKANYGKKSTQTRIRQYQLGRDYGISADDYNSMLVAQDYKCCICGSTTPRYGRKHFSVDHDHSSGAVRGLLCGACNSALGYMKDNPERLRRAADYLERAS